MKQLILLRIRIAGHTRQQLAPGYLLDSPRPVSNPAPGPEASTPRPGLTENVEFHAALGLKTHQEALS